MHTVTLAYEEFGDSSSQPLIILHGFFASSRNWRQIAKKMAGHYHIYVLDMRNHGLSPHQSEMDYPSMAADVLSFMQQHDIQSCHILGHSMGGKIAMWLALNYPERIQNLIVADISPVSYQHSFDQTILALKALPLAQISNRKQADEHLSISIPEMSYRQFLLQNLYLSEGQYSWRIDLDVFYHTADNIIGFPDTELSSKLDDKVLFIMGEKSTYLHQKTIDDFFPNAQVCFLKDAHHWLHVEKPEEFCVSVIEFLNIKE